MIRKIDIIRCIFSIFIMFISLPVNAQTDKEIDDMVKQMYAYIGQINDTLNICFSEGRFKDAIGISEEVKDYFTDNKLAETFFYAYILQDLTWAYEYDKNTTKVYEYGTQAISLYNKYELYKNESELTTYLDLLGYVGTASMNLKKYEESIKYFEKKISLTSNDYHKTEDYAYSLYSLGVAYNFLLTPNLSEKYLNEAKSIYKELGNNSFVESIEDFVKSNIDNRSILNNDRNELIKELDECKERYGINDTVYLSKLIDTGLLCSDTIYHELWQTLTIRLIEAKDILPKVYGIDSEDYRLYMVVLNNLSLGRYFGGDSYVNDIWDVIATLEDIYPKVRNNKIEFATILSSYYQYKLRDEDKTIYWLKQKFFETKKIRKEKPLEYQYAVSFLVSAYAKYGKSSQFKKMVNELDLSNMTLNEQQISWGNILVSLPPTTSDDICKILIDKYGTTLGRIKDILMFTITMCKANRLELISYAENACKLNSSPETEQYNHYRTMATFCSLNGNWGNSIEYEKKCLELAHRINDRKLLYSNDDIHLCEHIGHSYYQLGKYADAVNWLETALRDIEFDFGKCDKHYYSIVGFISSIYSNQLANYNKSYEYEGLKLESAECIYGLDSEEYASNLAVAAGDLRNLGKPEEAIKLLENYFNENNSINDSIKCSICNALGQAYQENHYFGKAENYYKKGIELSNSQKQKITLKSNLADLFIDEGLSAIGIKLKEELLEETVRCLSNDTIALIHAYDGIAHSYLDLDKNKALYYLEQTEKYFRSTTPIDRMISHFFNKSLAYENNLYMSELCLKKAEDIFFERDAKDSLILADIYKRQGDFYQKINDNNKAWNKFQQSFEIYKNHDISYGQSSFLSLLNNMGVLADELGDSQEAITIDKYVCEAYKTTLGATHPTYLNSLANLILAYIDADSINIAKSCIQELDSQSFYCPEFLPRVQGLYSEFFYSSGDYNKALEKANIYYSLISAEKDKNERMMNSALLQKAKIYRKLKMTDITNTQKERLKIEKERILQDLLYVSTDVRRNWNDKIENLKIEYVQDVDITKEMIPVAWNAVLFGKGLLFHTSNEIDKILKRTKGAKNDYLKIQELRSQYTSALSRNNKILSDSLNANIQSMEKELNNKYLSLRDLLKRANPTIDNIIDKLNAEQSAVEFVRYIKDGQYSYGAFVISKSNPAPQFIYLCNESAIDSVSNIKNIASYSNGLLYNYIWQEIKPYLHIGKDVFFSADGLLHKITIEMAFSQKGICISDEYKLHRVYHLSDINTKNNSSNKNIVAFGGIDYTGTSDFYTNNVTEESETMRTLTELSLAKGLPGTIGELDSLSALCSSKKTNLKVHRGTNASEDSFKSYSNTDVEILHLATHGFYWSNLAKINKRYQFATRMLTNGVTSVSGLLMSGASDALFHNPANNENDGILTSDEIECLNFSNLNIAFLSACETGLGDTDTDGVWGLQRAFRIAGCSNLICTTRTISDTEEPVFVTTFYKNILNGYPVYDAFCAARKALYNKYPLKPRSWTSFILVE